MNLFTRPIIINGYPQSGKDTFVELCSKYAVVENVLTSTPAKEALKLLGWDGEKTPEAREMLAYLMEESYEMFQGPIKYVMEKFELTEAELFFIHVREPHNIATFTEELPNAMVIFVDRDEAANKEFSNDSDRDVEMYPYDLIIDNNSDLSNLELIAQTFVQIVKKGAF